MKLIAGTTGPYQTGTTVRRSDADSTIVEVEGDLISLRSLNPAAYCPAGMVVESSEVYPTTGGHGKLSVSCVKYNSGSSFSAEKTTFRVDMLEVQYDLENHPAIADDRNIILKWLSTPESKRIDKDGYLFYEDGEGTLVAITEEDVYAEMFITAYMAGIRTFNRYYPVIERISTYKNPPGMNMSGRSFTGGSPTFSNGVGKYDNPPLSLNGYGNGHWFKSKDSWMQNADTTWTRTEQWTYTPEASDGENGWVYTSLT